MATKKKLTDQVVAAMRWEFENTPTTWGGLATKYGVDRTTVKHWAHTRGWLKHGGVATPTPAQVAKRQAKAREKEIQAAERYAYDETMATGLAKHLGVNRRTGKPLRDPPAVQPGKPYPEAGPAQSPVNSPLQPGSRSPAGDATTNAEPEAKTAPEKSPKKSYPGARIISFPGAKPPPPKPDNTPFPQRSKAEEAELRTQLSSLRGSLALTQIRQIERHERLLNSYTHLMQVYLTPNDYVDVEGLDEDAAQEKLLKVQRAALSLLLPTEGDSLWAAMKVANASAVTLITLKRTIGGPGKPGTGPPADVEDGEQVSNQRMANLAVKDLRQVKAAMLMLAGEELRANEPPKPPEPESLEDLRRPAIIDPPAD